MAISIEKLRKKIDEQHKKALAALEAFAGLQEYLDDDAIREALGDRAPVHVGNGKPPPAKSGEDKSNREKVFDVIRGKWAGLKEIRETSGLSNKQIWGVLTAPHLTSMIERRDAAGGAKEYRLREKEKPEGH